MLEKGLSLTVVIPTYNRAPILEKCLEALAAQTISSRSFQVVVADDGSTDDTKERVQRFEGNIFREVRYIRQPNSGQNAARNRAVREADGNILLFINDDTVASPTMIDEHRQYHEKYPEESVAVLGRITISPEVPLTPFAKLHLDSGYALWEGKTELDWHAFYTCNVSMKKAFLIKNGPFDEDMRYNDDLEMAERLSHKGLRIIYNPHAVGFHYHYLSERSYLDLAKLSGRTLAVWYKKSPHLKEELASIGFYLTASPAKRLKYFIGDLLVNKRTIPSILCLARRCGESRENISLMLYRKVYKALERDSIRNELRKG